MVSRAATLGALLLVGACRDGCHPRPDPATDRTPATTANAAPSTTFPPPLKVVELARVNDRFEGLRLDASFVYVDSLLGSRSRRVPKSGGPIEIISDGAPHGIPNQRHVYSNGYPSDVTHTYEGDGADSFSISGSSVYRTGPSVKRADHMEAIADVQQDVSVSNIARSVLIVDDTNVYWIGGGVNEVFSVPRLGGATKKLAHVMAGMGAELAIVGDTIYAIDIDGSIERLEKNGPENQDAKYVGRASVGLFVNAIWAETDGNILFIASDSAENMSANPPVFDSRVVKLELPAN